MSYDVFLSHNSKDKCLVRGLADWLTKNGVTSWFDEEQLLPGDRLTTELGKALDESRSAIICIGPDGEGPWQSEEVDTLLNRSIKLSRVKDEFRIIPVLLPEADTSKLNWFLETRLWVDLRSGITDNEAELHRLKQAIKGEAGPPAKDGHISGETAPPFKDNPEFNPYPGLSAFQEKDVKFFFGRNKESRDLAKRLRDKRFAIVIGPSGNGKSSLLRAGLHLETVAGKEGILPNILKWKSIIVKPGTDLLHNLLIQLYASHGSTSRSEAVANSMSRIQLETVPITAEKWAEGLNQELLAFYANSDQNVLIIIDQFEELFTHRMITTQDDQERQLKIQCTLDGLAYLHKLGDKRWHIAISLRSDFYQRCRTGGIFWNLIEKTGYRLDLDELDEVGWRDAIKGPAARSGAYLEAGLVETLIKDIYRQRGSMPLLQLTLQDLWKNRIGACLTHDSYSDIGGISNALQERAENCFKNLRVADGDYLEIARNIFIRLTTPGEGVSDTRRRIGREELDWKNTDSEKINQVIATLSNSENRLIVTDEFGMEVTHEILIQDCSTIRNWIETARYDIPFMRRLTNSASQWDANSRPRWKSIHLGDSPEFIKQWLDSLTLKLTNLESSFWKAARLKNTLQQILRGVVFIFIIVVTGVAIAKAYDAYNSNKLTQKVLVKNYVRFIGIELNEVSPLEREVLWELAATSPELEDIREKTLEMTLKAYVKNPETFLKPLLDGGYAFRAVTGILASRWIEFETKTYTLFKSSLKKTASSVVKSDVLLHAQCVYSLTENMEASVVDDAAILIAETFGKVTNQDALNALSESFSNLGGAISEKTSEKIGPLIVKELGRSTSLEDKKILSSALASLSGRILEVDAIKAGNLIVEEIEKSSDSQMLLTLSEALASLRDDVPEDIFYRAASRIVEVMGIAKDLQEFWALSEALSSLGEKIPEDEDVIFNTASKLIVTKIEKSTNPESIKTLSSALSNLKERTPDAIEKAASLIILRMEEATTTRKLVSLIEALTYLKERIPEDTASRAARFIFKSMEKYKGKARNSDTLKYFCSSLLKLGATVPKDVVNSAASLIVDEMEKKNTPNYLKNLSKALSDLGWRVPGAEVSRACNIILVEMEKDSKVFLSLNSALEYLGDRIPKDVAQKAALLIVAEMERADPEELQQLSETLVSFGRKIPQDAAQTAAPLIVLALEQSRYGTQITSLSTSLGLIVQTLTNQKIKHQNDHLITADVQEEINSAEDAKKPFIDFFQTSAFAMSNMLLEPISENQENFPERSHTRRQLFSQYCDHLSPQQLAEVLKWPFSIGEAEDIVLETLERKLSKHNKKEIRFLGKLRNFVMQAEDLGIKNLKSPAHHPTAKAALDELGNNFN
jgi:Novel STAND NTPase 1/TIR domain